MTFMLEPSAGNVNLRVDKLNLTKSIRTARNLPAPKHTLQSLLEQVLILRLLRW